jgi:hypothetical protein
MLLLETKSVAFGATIVKLYSLDGGKLWFTRASDVKQFKRRRHQDEETLRYYFRWHVDGRPVKDRLLADHG